MWSKNLSSAKNFQNYVDAYERSAELHPRVEYVLLMGHSPSRYDVATSLRPFKDDGITEPRNPSYLTHLFGKLAVLGRTGKQHVALAPSTPSGDHSPKNRLLEFQQAE